MKKRNGQYIHMEQTSSFTHFSNDGTPLLALGFLYDITNRVTDNRILHTIEQRGVLGNKSVFSRIYFPDKKLLTKREIDVAKLIMQGMRNDEIAAILGISTNTVEEYRKSIIRKTACKTMEQAIGIIQEKGWTK